MVQEDGARGSPDTWLWKVVGLVAIIFLVVAVILIGLVPFWSAHAQDPSGEYAAHPGPYHNWIVTQMEDDHPTVSCCGGGDMHYVDVQPSRTAVSGWAILIDGAWWDYNKTLPFHENPMGRNAAWWSYDVNHQPIIYCLRLATGT